ncbi:ATP-dependent DNA helicase RecG [Fretibacterium fastidiosum]|uniref:ATP-dependent DNA helicase RecG n=1 Tax=Fretibacterium fastidiosum TaxID=651822 RepID=UPI0002F8075B|nr:ATP-dependent DNA helicase RecG [Fretibacterium fastidiosum]
MSAVRGSPEGLTSPIRYLKGVGARVAELLARLGVHTVEDILYFFPRRYEDRRGLVPFRELRIGTTASAVAEVRAVSSSASRFGGPASAVLDDGSASIRAVWFNPHAARSLKPGMQLALYGRVEYYNGVQLTNPEFEVLEAGQPPELVGHIVPVYPTAAFLTQKRLRRLVDTALEEYGGSLDDFLPRRIRERHGMKGLTAALQELHHPSDPESWLRARNRLAFDELFLLQTGLAMRHAADAALPERSLSLAPGQKFHTFERSLPFSLTPAQQRVIGEIFRDLGSSIPMNRLLQGDVGSGKTLVAVAAILAAVDSGAQAVLMAPTEVLAQQHDIRIGKMLESLGVKTALLTGTLHAPERRALLQALGAGEVHLLIGTHAVFTDEVNFLKLGLTVVDEQHRFGVRQKNALIAKGVSPHVLVMTATPIPRTLVLSVYGDLAVSTLDELPPGRQPVETLHMRTTDEVDLFRLIEGRIQAGQQVYWVCPLIDDEEGQGLDSVTSRCQRLTSALPGARIGVLHGRLPIEEKTSVMQDFVQRRLDLLVATVIIEVGLDIPEASMMVISDAGQFGLAQLHQLRGRIGRGTAKGLCVLLEGETTTPEGRERIETMLSTSDGFAIAEADLQQRGPGEVCGVHQHGVTDFRVANLLKDQKLLELARLESRQLLAADPELTGEPLLRSELKRRLGASLDLAGTA